ncbi:MAG: hypothetical protein M9894_17325 [Planctomycetes bacterium]|nr:hypothetical protein [Planctomycetota bacterium]
MHDGAGRSRGRGLAPSVLALAVVAVALHARPLLGGHGFGSSAICGPPWRPGGPAPNLIADVDPVHLELPEARLVARTGARWDPTRGLGEPIGLASWPTLTHPLAWPLYRLLGPVAATAALTALHVLAGGLCCLLHLRWRGVGAAAALLGALAFELSPLFSAWGARPWVTAAMPWGALALWASDALARRPGPRPAAGLAAAVGGGLLCALPQLMLLVAAAAGALAVAGARRRRAAACWAGAGLALAAALAAPRLLPLAAVLPHTSRQAFSFAEWHDRTVRLGPEALTTLVVPDARGHPMRWPDAPRPMQSLYDNVQEQRVYLGLPVLALALAGAAAGGVRRHAAALVLALLLAFPTPLAFLLFVLPGQGATSPTRSLWLVPLLAPLLVARGAAALRRGDRAPALAAAGVLAVTAVVAARLALEAPDAFAAAAPGWVAPAALGPVLLACATLSLTLLARAPRARRAAGALLAGLVAAELLREARAYQVTSPGADFYVRTPEVDAVEAVTGDGRALVLPPLQPNALAAADLRAVGSYGALHSARLAELLAALGHPAPSRQYLRPGELPPAWRDALAVRAVLGGPGAAVQGPDLEPVLEGPTLRVWRAPGALPRARLVPPEALVEVEGRAAARAALAWPGLDPRRHHVLETGRRGPPPRPDAPPPEQVEVLVDEPERVVARVAAPRGGALVVADAFAPGWRAETGDGAPLPLVPATLALRGVPLPAGFEGEVVLRYAPPRWRAGLLVGCLALLVALALSRCSPRR